MERQFDFDYIIVGSGFGGSVSALRLSEKGYNVLVIEKGRWKTSKDFPTTNWDLRKWMWMPALRFFGFFKLTFFRHVTALSGVGVGGGSLVYANTLPIPKPDFFTSKTWSHLANWETELKPFYSLALKMLGAARNPRMETGDKALLELSKQIGKEKYFELANVAVYFGEPGRTVKDPYFDGRGPDRSGCTFCGGCMIGCRNNAKNTLDKNYLYLAQQLGATIQAESEVVDAIASEPGNGAEGYIVKWKSSTAFRGKRGEYTARGIIFAGGVLGTVRLLFKLKRTSLRILSEKLGSHIRTNSESLVGVTTFDKQTAFSDGIAVSSILHTDEYTHLEPARFPAGSGFWRLLMSPLVHGSNPLARILKILCDWIRHPVGNLKSTFVSDWGRKTQILLFMRSINDTLRFSTGLFGMGSSLEKGNPPTAFIPEAKAISEKYARIVNGKPAVLLMETILGIPTTAHILGGCAMGKDRDEGVIDKDNRVFGYANMYICDGSAISANVGVNPALTITALTERAMSKIPNKKDLDANGLIKSCE